LGPSIGTATWSLFHRNKAEQMSRRDKQFFDHIRKMRADPTRQVVHNPLPDYYVCVMRSLLMGREKKLARCTSTASGSETR